MNIRNYAVPALILALIIGLSFTAWFRHERRIVIGPGISLPPRTTIIEERKQETPVIDIVNYRCSNPHSTEIILNYFHGFSDNGWAVEKKGANIILLRKNSTLMRVVLHPQTKKTVFTVNLRSGK